LEFLELKKITSKVGMSKVKIKNAHFYSIVTFSAGRKGKREAGDFAFWIAVVDRKKCVDRGVIARASLYYSPGERFDRMNRERKKEPEYNKIWKFLGGGKKIKHIRPATGKEIYRWMKSHKEDSRFVKSIRINGKSQWWLTIKTVVDAFR
jgi:hypothetical protein